MSDSLKWREGEVAKALPNTVDIGSEVGSRNYSGQPSLTADESLTNVGWQVLLEGPSPTSCLTWYRLEKVLFQASFECPFWIEL